LWRYTSINDMHLTIVKKMAENTPQLEQNHQLLFNIEENVINSEGLSDFTKNEDLPNGQVHETIKDKPKEQNQNDSFSSLSEDVHVQDAIGNSNF